MKEKRLPKLLFILSLLIAVLVIFETRFKGTAFELNTYLLIPNWYMSAFVGRISLGFVLFFAVFGFTTLNKFLFKLFYWFTAFILAFVITRSIVVTETLSSLGANSLLYFSIVLVIGLLVYLFRNKLAFIKGKWAWITVVLSIVLGQTFTFITNPLFPEDFTNGEGIISDDVKLYHPIETEKAGKVLYVYGKPGCPYCKRAIYRITKTLASSELKNSVIIRFPGTNKEYEAFEKYITKYLDSDLDWEIRDVNTMYEENNGGSVPKFYLLQDGELIKYWSGETFNYSVLNNLEEILK